MTLAAPLGLWALLAVPAVVLLHWFRRRLPERRVAGLFLFGDAGVVAVDGPRRAPLQHSWSLWLECFAALAAALWLAGPCTVDPGRRHLVLVLDASASMAAVGTRERVLAAATEMVRGLGADDVVSVVETAAQPQLLLGPRAASHAVAAALAAWRPMRPAHGFEAALDLARQLAADVGEVVFLTDGEPGPLPDVHCMACGAPQANAALQSVERVADAAGELAILRVRRFGGDSTALSLRRDGLVFYQTTLPMDGALVPAAAAQTLEVTVPLPAGIDVLEVVLGDDALALDNLAVLVAEPPTSVLVHDRLPPALRQALGIERLATALGDWREVADASAAQLVLAAAPGLVHEGQIEVVVATSAGARAGHLGPFVCDRAHPWLQGVELAGVAWVSGSGSVPGDALVALGNKVLLSEEWLPAGRRLWLDVDPTAGNLVQAPDWPILFHNLLAACRDSAPGIARRHVLLGEHVLFRRAGGVAAVAQEPLWLAAPDASRSAMALGVPSVLVPTVPGLHRVVAAEGEERDRFAVRFCDLAESDLRQRASFDRPAAALAQHGEDPAAVDAARWRRWLGLLLVGLVVLDWWLLARRTP